MLVREEKKEIDKLTQTIQSDIVTFDVLNQAKVKIEGTDSLKINVSKVGKNIYGLFSQIEIKNPNGDPEFLKAGESINWDDG